MVTLHRVLHGNEDQPRHAIRNGVEIVRVASTSFERSKLGARAANYMTYLTSALLHGLRGEETSIRTSQDVMVFSGLPPRCAELVVEMETRGRAHVDLILGELTGAGFPARTA